MVTKDTSINLQSFKSAVAPAGRDKRDSSKLDPLESGIKELRSDGYSWRQIESWVNENGIKATASEIQRFHARRTK